MNFLNAVEAMLDGKKVKSKSLVVEHTIYMDKTGEFISETGERPFTLTSGRLLADWEIVEEKTLSDKIYKTRDTQGYFEVTDVKESLKEYLDKIEEYMKEEHSIFWKAKVIAKEVFGKKLLE